MGRRLRRGEARGTPDEAEALEVDVTGNHDGSCSHHLFDMFYKNEGKISALGEEIRRQLANGALQAAMDRAAARGHPERVVVHIGIMCNKARHRPEGSADMLQLV